MKALLFSLMAILTLSFVSFTNADNSGYKVGDKAKDFKLKNIDGKMVSMQDYQRATGIILIFTCNHCPFSVAYEDRIIELHNKYASKGYPVVAINSNDAIAYPADSYENMIERAQEKKFPFAYLHDETQDFAKLYGAAKTPHVFILKKVGTEFVVSYIGAIDDNSNEPELVKTKFVENALNEMLDGKEVSQPSTKAVGCSIKWKK
ncbi:MAG TPA: thioredoxin family protein [Chitinophagaceae bacterium]|jgi:peroxiredoxin|nr:thioredoxin family protein [Chitinophagaceae bacterium]